MKSDLITILPESMLWVRRSNSQQMAGNMTQIGTHPPLVKYYIGIPMILFHEVFNILVTLH